MQYAPAIVTPLPLTYQILYSVRRQAIGHGVLPAMAKRQVHIRKYVGHLIVAWHEQERPGFVACITAHKYTQALCTSSPAGTPTSVISASDTLPDSSQQGGCVSFCPTRTPQHHSPCVRTSATSWGSLSRQKICRSSHATLPQLVLFPIT